MKTSFNLDCMHLQFNYQLCYNNILLNIMEVEKGLIEFFLPGEEVSKQRINFNPINLYQVPSLNAAALKFGQISKKQIKNDSNQKT